MTRCGVSGSAVASAPSASETALAMAAPAAASRPRPRPSTPSGFSGEGASSVTRTSTARRLGGGREQVVHERAGDELALGVVGQLLEQRAAEALRRAPPTIWPSIEHRVDGAADVVGDRVAVDAHAARLEIDLDGDAVQPVGKAHVLAS